MVGRKQPARALSKEIPLQENHPQEQPIAIEPQEIAKIVIDADRPLG